MNATLVSARSLSPTVRQLELSPEGHLDYAPGQWLNVHLEDEGEPLTRAYSIANAPREDGVVELAVTRVPHGAASPVLHRLPVGASVQLDGPHGFFVRDRPRRATPTLFVGAGTGLAPLRAMLQAEVGQGAPPLALLFGCRTTGDILWHEEQEAWRRAGVRVEVSLSRGEEGWSGRRGYVQDHVVELARALDEPDVYICGLSRMVKEVRAALKSQLGYTRQKIHSERYD